LNRPDPTPAARWNFVAALAAWVLPGLGHYLLGERQRGSILAAGIGVLWLAGFLIGGISVFDHVEHPAWFLGQMLVAPSVGADVALQALKSPRGAAPMPDEQPRYEPGYGRVNEQGTLYTALAGLLNLLAIMDVLYRDGKRQRLDISGDQERRAAGGPA